MQANQYPPDTFEAPDSTDLDALESLAVSDGYALIAKRVADVIEQKRDELERNSEESRAVPFAQGFLAACRMFLALPAQIQSEIQSDRSRR